MAQQWKYVELVIVVETDGTGRDDEQDGFAVVKTCQMAKLTVAVSFAKKRSKDYPSRTIAVLTWSLHGGTHVEYATLYGEPMEYYPSIVRTSPQRWNAVIAPTIEQHLSTYLRSQIPVEAPHGFSADVDADADTDDAIESPFVGEAK